jgi:hypothetical protein
MLSVGMLAACPAGKLVGGGELGSDRDARADADGPRSPEGAPAADRRGPATADGERRIEAGRDHGATDGKPTSPDLLPPLRDDALTPWTWHQQSLALLDQSVLGKAFAAAGYAPPAGSYLLAVRVVPGLAQPAFAYYSLAATATTYSAGAYWPASTVKLAAAVGALRTLGKHQLTGAASVSFTDDDGSYSGTVKSLYSQALEVSSNVAYNRLMEIAGFDEINDQYLTAAESLPSMVLQRRYTHPLPTSNLRTSPAIAYSEGALAGTLPKRVGVGQHPECPSEGNCVTLLELLDLMRRVTLHHELPAGDRFPLAAADVAALQASLEASPTRMEPGASQALGHPVKVYNKTGEVAGDDRLDHGLIVDTVGGARFLLALAMPYDTTSDAAASTLARQALLALVAQPAAGPALQRAAGSPITVQIDDQGPGKTPGTRAHRLTIAAPGADSLELFVDGYALPKPAGPSPWFLLDHDFSKAGDRLLVVRARAAGALVGYRALAVHLN